MEVLATRNHEGTIRDDDSVLKIEGDDHRIEWVGVCGYVRERRVLILPLAKYEHLALSYGGLEV
jgi:hypothetical protein